MVFLIDKDKKGDKTMTYNEVVKAEEAKVGDLIAHWRRRLTDKDVAAVRDIVTNAVKNGIGAKCTIDIELKRNHWVESMLGYDAIVATVKVCKPFEAVRTIHGDLVKGLKTITLLFDKTAGLYSYEKHMERQRVEDELFSTMPRTKAMAAYDALPWDEESVSFDGRTDGKVREYLRGWFYPYEGRNHSGYVLAWEGIKV